MKNDSYMNSKTNIKCILLTLKYFFTCREKLMHLFQVEYSHQTLNKNIAFIDL